MNKMLIIIRREVKYRIGKKSFIILTLLMPFIFAALIFVPLWLANIKDGEQKKVVIIDTTGEYAPLFKTDKSFLFVTAAESNYRPLSDSTETEAVVSITGNLTEHPEKAVIYSRKEVPLELSRRVNDVLSQKIRHDKLAQYNVPNLDRIIRDSETKFDIKTVKWSDTGEASVSDADMAAIAGFLFTFLIYMFVMMYGGMVMQSVMEEKTNRIVEIMVSSVKPFQLMMGKIIGIALTGFLQLAVWGVMLAVLLTSAEAVFGVTAPAGAALPGQPMMPSAGNADTAAILSAIQHLPFAEMTVMFVLCFIGGYLLYASFFAAVGASINTHEDSSQFMTPVVLIMVFGLYAAMYSVENPDGPLAMWCSFIPLTSPIVMMVRVPFGVPLWQEALSLLILFLTAFAVTWMAGKIYRVGILMYGKKPSIKEMIKWMKY